MNAGDKKLLFIRDDSVSLEWMISWHIPAAGKYKCTQTEDIKKRNLKSQHAALVVWCKLWEKLRLAAGDINCIRPAKSVKPAWAHLCPRINKNSVIEPWTSLFLFIILLLETPCPFVRWFVGHVFYPHLTRTSLRGSHGLSARRARRTKSSRPEGPQTRSWGPEGPLNF